MTAATTAERALTVEADLPAREIPFARVDCSGDELKNIAEVLRSGWLTTATKARELEERFASRIGVRHALAVNSCTSALHLALEALGVTRGDKVLVPTMTFTSTVEVVRYLDAEPVLLDVDPGTSNLSAAIVARALAEHPDAKVLLVVHYGGQPAPMLDDDKPGILSLCKQHGVRVVEDAAHAFPARLGDRHVGNFGDITCFSFYANKTMTTGEGGMVVTNSDGLAARMSTMRLHGIDRPVWERYTDRKNSWEYDVIAPGFKYNMPDLNAAVGLAQLDRAHHMRSGRERCARFYTQAFQSVPELRRLVQLCTAAEHSWHLYPVLLGPDAPLTRDEFIAELAKCGIGASVHYKPVHRLSYYGGEFGFHSEDFPGAEHLWSRTVSLPIYNLMTKADLTYVAQCVKRLLK